ncbi:YdbH domain-containing protein [Pseudoalteromonas sp.]|uniref:YdbH domain-containing protein n=1 Tax=Pseudoalteromonas sp. TaxID=53249 RepID=UPI0030011132
MFKRVGWGLLILLLSVLTLGYVFRMPITLHFVAPSLQNSGVELHCLDWSLTSNLDLHVERACIGYQGQQLELADITVNTKQVIINRANLRLVTPAASAESSKAKKLALTLIESRPLLTVKRLVILHSQLAKPLTISVDEPALNQFVVSGDLTASATLFTDRVTGQVKLDNELVSKVKHFTQLHIDSQNRFSFDGLSLALDSQIDAQYIAELENCAITFKADGNVGSQYDLNSQQLTLDAQQLTSSLDAQAHCLQQIAQLTADTKQQQFIAKQIPLHWQLQLPAHIVWQDNSLQLDTVNLVAASSELRVNNLNVNINDLPNSLKAGLAFKLQNDDIKKFSLTTNVANHDAEGTYQLELVQLPDFIAVDAKNVASNGEFTVKDFLTAAHGRLSAKLAIGKLAVDELTVNKYQGTLTAKINEHRYTTAALVSQVDTINVSDYKLTQLKNNLNASGDLGVGELFIDITSETSLAALQSELVDLNNIKIRSQAMQSRALQASHQVMIDDIEAIVTHHMSSTEHPVEVIIPEQSVSRFNPLLHQFAPLATLTDGTVSAQVKGDVNLLAADMTLQLNGINGLYTDYLINGFNSQLAGRYDSGQLNVKPTKFDINELRAGAIVENITGLLQLQDNEPIVTALNGDVMGGSFTLDEYRVTEQPQQALLTFKNIDASKVITLDEKSGISLTGRVAGKLPVYFNQSGVEVKDGQLTNQGAAKLLITNNAAFDAVKAQQQELGPILGLLEDLDIESIKSSVNLKPDGWMTLGVNLQGYNKPQAQQVNFNYNHEENVFTLLRALRLSDEITQKVEQQYSTKGSNND